MALLSATASAERRTESSGFTGTVLSLSPNEEHGKKKKKQLAAKPAKSKQAFKVVPTQRVIVEPAATVPGVDVVDGVQVPKDLNETSNDVPGDPEDVPGDLVDTQDDPLEGFNRAMFGFNQVVDHLVFEPAARVYRAVIPPPVRRGVSNVVTNLASPITLTNDVLQGNPEAAANTIKRFMINSTIGLGGIFDHASGLGEPLHREDFGQTLGTWGVGGSPYIVLPLLGPSNPRDMVGKVADTAVNPMTWILYDAPFWERSIPVGVEVVSGREAILDDYDNLRKNSPDLYASVRDLYAQKRQAEIANEAAGYDPGAGVSSLPPASIPQTLNPY
ncbi:MAG: VacJ family lipoprotein [Parvibaculaceae bacterium]